MDLQKSVFGLWMQTQIEKNHTVQFLSIFLYTYNYKLFVHKTPILHDDLPIFLEGIFKIFFSVRLVFGHKVLKEF